MCIFLRIHESRKFSRYCEKHFCEESGSIVKRVGAIGLLVRVDGVLSTPFCSKLSTNVVARVVVKSFLIQALVLGGISVGRAAALAVVVNVSHFIVGCDYVLEPSFAPSETNDVKFVVLYRYLLEAYIIFTYAIEPDSAVLSFLGLLQVSKSLARPRETYS